jgi:hypothetical protein
MLSIQSIAKEFNMSPKQLTDESLRLYLRQELIKVETELFRYAQKYGVTTVEELDKKLQTGILKEEDIHDDFFVFDHLEYEKERLLTFLNTP